jgi:hypothetical protein
VRSLAYLSILWSITPLAQTCRSSKFWPTQIAFPQPVKARTKTQDVKEWVMKRSYVERGEMVIRRKTSAYTPAGALALGSANTARQRFNPRTPSP